MPRTGGGTGPFVLNPVYLAVPGTTILATQHNTPLEDIEDTFNIPQPIAYGGTQAASAIEAMDNLFIVGADKASSASIDLDNVTGSFVNITGTTPVTSIALAEGSIRFARAVAALPLTASASLIVNGSTTQAYTCEAGDQMMIVGYAAAVVRVWVQGRNKFIGSQFKIADGTDQTKLVQFNASGLTTGMTRTYSFPDTSGTLLVTGSSTLTLESTDAGAAAAPILDLYRNSPTPAVNDILGQVVFNGEDSAGNAQEYGSVEAVITDPVSTSEDGRMDFYAVIAGVRTRVISVGPNLNLAAIGQIQFPATQNPSGNANTLDDYAEQSTSPTMTATSGTFTSVACDLRFTKIGRSVFVYGEVNLQNVGSAAGNINIPLPYTPTFGGGGGGVETVLTGNALSIFITAGSANLVVAKYDGTTIIGSGRFLRFSGSFIV